MVQLIVLMVYLTLYLIRELSSRLTLDWIIPAPTVGAHDPTSLCLRQPRATAIFRDCRLKSWQRARPGVPEERKSLLLSPPAILIAK